MFPTFRRVIIIVVKMSFKTLWHFDFNLSPYYTNSGWSTSCGQSFRTQTSNEMHFGSLEISRRDLRDKSCNMEATKFYNALWLKMMGQTKKWIQEFSSWNSQIQRLQRWPPNGQDDQLDRHSWWNYVYYTYVGSILVVSKMMFLYSWLQYNSLFFTL